MTAKSTKHDQSDDRHLIEAARKSVDQIWQAGLGAFARAQQEGEEMYSRLVQEGMAVQKRTQHMAGERLAGLTDTIAKMADSLGKQATGSLEKLETVFEERVARSLQNVGVPTRDDIQSLSAQIRELKHAVDAMAAGKPAARAATKTSAKTASKAAQKTAAPAGKRAVAKAAKPASTRAAAGSKRSAAASHRA